MRQAIFTLLVLAVASGAAFADDGDGSALPTTRPVPKPPMVTAAEWGSTPQPIPDARRHVPQFVTVHHAGVFWKSTGDPARMVKNMQAWGQRDKNWPDLPYHFLIAPDGRIFEGRSLDYEPESNTKYDLQGHVGIELMGDFTRQRMTEAQLRSLVNVVAWVCAERQIDPARIAGHKDRAQTSCPGTDCYRYIESGQLRAWVEETLAGRSPDVRVGAPLPDGPTIFVGDPAGDPPPSTQPTTRP